MFSFQANGSLMFAKNKVALVPISVAYNPTKRLAGPSENNPSCAWILFRERIVLVYMLIGKDGELEQIEIILRRTGFMV